MVQASCGRAITIAVPRSSTQGLERDIAANEGVDCYILSIHENSNSEGPIILRWYLAVGGV